MHRRGGSVSGPEAFARFRRRRGMMVRLAMVRWLKWWSWCCYWSFDARGHQLADTGLDGINGSVVTYWYDAIGFARGDLLVLLIDAAVEVVGLAFETILVGAGLLDVFLIAA